MKQYEELEKLAAAFGLGRQQVISTIRDLYDWQVKGDILKKWLRNCIT